MQIFPILKFLYILLALINISKYEIFEVVQYHQKHSVNDWIAHILAQKKILRAI